MLRERDTSRPVGLQKSPCTAVADADAPVLRYRTREAGRSLVPASDRSGLGAHSLDPPDAAIQRMAGFDMTTTADRLIVFISSPSAHSGATETPSTWFPFPLPSRLDAFFSRSGLSRKTIPE